MKALIQRVGKGRVLVDGKPTGEIGFGFVVFLGVKQGDTEIDAKYLAEKTSALRIFPDEHDQMNTRVHGKGKLKKVLTANGKVLRFETKAEMFLNVNVLSCKESRT